MPLPPATPAYILRGHGAQIHAASFWRDNSRLVTGDAEGWVVVWSLATKRAVAVWRAHEGSILGVKGWGEEKLITHGKDNTLSIWSITTTSEKELSTVLPVDTPPSPRPKPWLLHMLQVNTMNFCSFASCTLTSSSQGQERSEEELLIAVPNTLTSETVDIFHLPSSIRKYQLKASPLFKGGMIMALSLFNHPKSGRLTVIAGFESGHTSITVLESGGWRTISVAKAHSQPLLSLDVRLEKEFYFTSAADALITKHLIPAYSQQTTYATSTFSFSGSKTAPSSLLSASFASAKNTPQATPKEIQITEPEKILNTKHAGQQSLQIRNDGKIFATAGWDGRVRVYDTLKMKEVAVLKWAAGDGSGVYAVAFADVELPGKDVDTGNRISIEREQVKGGREIAERALVQQPSTTTTRQDRARKAEQTHWIAVGSKDGKISLWNIY